MLISEREQLQQDIRTWIAQYGADRSALIPVLQAVQQKHHYISEFVMQIIADELEIHPVEVYGVTTFYQFLGQQEKGTYTIRLCRTISCDMARKSAVAQQLENDLGITFGETTKDGLFTLDWANCLGMCDRGPALLVNERIFTQVTPQKVREILDECRSAFGDHPTPSNQAVTGEIRK